MSYHHTISKVQNVDLSKACTTHTCYCTCLHTHPPTCSSLGLQNTSTVFNPGKCFLFTSLPLLSMTSAILRPNSSLRAAPSSTTSADAPRSLLAAIASENSRLNADAVPRKPGATKSVSAKNSSKLFWTGVPVRMMRRGQRRVLRADMVRPPWTAFSLEMKYHVVIEMGLTDKPAVVVSFVNFRRGI